MKTGQMDLNGGRLSFERFMELALYAPGLGYYNATDRQFGPEGDFITAPEISTLFAPCLARTIAPALRQWADPCLLEIGAGRGRLAVRLLQALRHHHGLTPRYLILERSSALANRQQKEIAQAGDGLIAACSWLTDWPEAGFSGVAGFDGVVVANELLDAIPAARFRIGEQGIEEGGVSWQNNAFSWDFRQATGSPLEAQVKELQQQLPHPLEIGYTSELHGQREAWVATLARRLQKALVLIIDYGYPRAEYYHPQRNRGTLNCHYRHYHHDDPFAFAGVQDMSVHVEFSGIARAAARAGLALAGFSSQGRYLLAAGILELAARTPPQDPTYPRLAQEIKTLTLPGEMGEVMKVLALTKNMETPLPGFEGRDLRATLA